MPSDIGKRLRLARIQAGLTQRETADRLGVSGRGWLSALESGKRSPYLDTVERLAAVYGVSVESLVAEGPFSR